MQNNLYKLSLVLFIIIAGFNVTAQQRSNSEKLNEISMQLFEEWELKRQRVVSYAEEHNLQIRQELEDGRLIQMVDVIDGIPEYYTTFNYGAAQTTRVVEMWEGGSSGLDITGEGYENLGEWDAGHVRKSHQEFTNEGASRVTNMDGENPTHYHATHVAGTMVAGGVNSNAKGMAYKGNLKAWDWNGDGGEMAAAAADGLEISNHSYGQVRGWDWNNGSWVWYGNENVDSNEDYNFGFYDGGARSFDMIAYNAPNYLIVKSAGNDRGEGPGNAGQNGNPEKDGGSDGYDCIGGSGVAKNILTVGAVHQVTNYNGPGSVIMSGFSAWGPADDGRVKPDIVGKGVSVYSTMDGSNNDYANLNGTSMSSPNVAGSMALLQKHYQDTHNGIPMLSSTLKGLVIHTADEAGPYEGPDYKFGWGLMNTLRAAELISENVDYERIEEIILEGGDLYMKQIEVSEGAELRITLCWTDPAGLPLPFELNPRDPMLVNDLDVVLLDANFNEIYPYSLDPESPGSQATTDSKNNVDNVEMIYLSSASAGSYTIMVTHDGWLENEEQTFSLIVTGVQDEDALPECSENLLSPDDGAVDILLNEYISWIPASNASSYDVYFGTDGGGIDQPTNIYNGENFNDNGFTYLMDPLQTYYLNVVPRNSIGTADDCNQVWSFTTMDAISEYPYSQNMNVASLPDLPPFWQSYDHNDAVWQSTDIESHSEDMAVLCALPDGINPTQMDNWFVSPPFLVESGMEYKTDFFFKNAVEGMPENIELYWGQSPMKNDLSNLVYQNVANDNNNWSMGSAVIQPDYDGLLFLGFYTYNDEGYGLLLDDFFINYWGPVNVEENIDDQDAEVYFSDGNIIIRLRDASEKAELSIYNQLGQLVQKDQVSGSAKINAGSITKAGVHIVHLKTKNGMTTKKIFVR